MLGYTSHPYNRQGVAFRKSDKELLMTDALTKFEKLLYTHNDDIFCGAHEDIDDLIGMVSGYNELCNTYKYYNDMLFDEISKYGIKTKRVHKARKEIIQLEDDTLRQKYLKLVDIVDELANKELTTRVEIRKLHSSIKDKVLYNLYLRKIRR